MIFNGGAKETWAFGATYPGALSGNISGLTVDAGNGGTASWNAIGWDAFLLNGTSLKLQVRTGNSVDELASAPFKGPDGTGATYFTSAPTALVGFPDSRFLEVKAILESVKSSASPIVNSISVGITPVPPGRQRPCRSLRSGET